LSALAANITQFLEGIQLQLVCMELSGDPGVPNLNSVFSMGDHKQVTPACDRQ